jgi:hypothetical protein
VLRGSIGFPIAEVLALRHQLNVLRRKRFGHLRLSFIDCSGVSLYPLWPEAGSSCY